FKVQSGAKRRPPTGGFKAERSEVRLWRMMCLSGVTPDRFPCLSDVPQQCWKQLWKSVISHF
ncbi:MAG: hypothetical protein KAG99_07845, partial [Bacteroidales bacterium]|nr:hypothetical protein [Bacteroidales bacterium]